MRGGGNCLNECKNKIRIAFFGGSTAVYPDFETPGSENIPSYLEKILKKKLKKDVIVMNYAAGGAAHRQHLHMLLEFMPEFKPDIVIFYGGSNETVQHWFFEPRPGYPMNFYYKAEFETWKKFLLEYSAVFSRLLGFKFEDDNNDKIKKRIKFRSRKWKKQIVKNYMETIELSKAAANTFKSDLFGTAVFIAVFQPINKRTPEYDEETVKEQNETINELRKSIKQLDYAYDFYDKYDVFPESVFYDNCHVKDKANRLMAEEIAKLLTGRYFKPAGIVR